MNGFHVSIYKTHPKRRRNPVLRIIFITLSSQYFRGKKQWPVFPDHSNCNIAGKYTWTFIAGNADLVVIPDHLVLYAGRLPRCIHCGLSLYCRNHWTLETALWSDHVSRIWHWLHAQGKRDRLVSSLEKFELRGQWTYKLTIKRKISRSKHHIQIICLVDSTPVFRAANSIPLISSPLAYWFPDWRNLSTAGGVLGLITCCIVFTLPTSPRWLYSRQNHSEGRKVLKHFATKTRSQLPKDFEREIVTDNTERINNEEQKVMTIIDVLKWRDFVLRLVGFPTSY